jgi:5-methylcytosine-specific restriction protein A
MPTLPGHPCAHPLCPAIVPAKQRYCTEHKGHDDKQRGTSTERGYGAHWRRIRANVLRRDGWQCQGSIETQMVERTEGVNIVIAGEAGPSLRCWNEATEVDHIIPKSQGGTDELDNLQSLCKGCHSRKTAKEGRWG